MSKDRAQKIKIILFDVDGVLTDGTIFLFPAPGGAQPAVKDAIDAKSGASGYGISSTSVVEAKGFSAHDGIGFSLARMGGLKTGLVTKRISETVALRARDLKVDHVYQGQLHKMETVREIMQKENITEAEIAYVGDDLVDLPVMRKIGLAIAVADAREEVKDEAHVITDHAGGRGAARDAIEYILKAQGKLRQVVDDYLAQR
jgi:3-deoxy-D-manno-octulosonate 8-phosphate phosphatase (KDO 8-P phosphatase)